MTLVERAKMVGRIVHANQKYGDNDYEVHLQAVHDVLVRFGVTDEKYLAAAWLHDSVEDQQMKLSMLKEYFGEQVAAMVHCLTNELGENRKERNIKTYPKLRKNQDALVVKLADRIANVENCILTGNSMYKKYRQEQPVFEYNTRDEKWDALWEHLNFLFKKSISIPKDDNTMVCVEDGEIMFSYATPPEIVF